MRALKLWHLRNAKVTEDISTHRVSTYVKGFLMEEENTCSISLKGKAVLYYHSTYKMRASVLSVKPVW